MGHYASEDFSLLVMFLLVTFSWLFRRCSVWKTVFGRFSWFFVAFPWPSFWANFVRTRPGKVF